MKDEYQLSGPDTWVVGSDGKMVRVAKWGVSKASVFDTCVAVPMRHASGAIRHAVGRMAQRSGLKK